MCLVGWQEVGLRNGRFALLPHMFQGPIPLDASQLIIHFEEFGPYPGVDVVIDL